jgi:hypothetical protein
MSELLKQLEDLDKAIQSEIASMDMHNKVIHKIAMSLINNGSDAELVNQLVHNSNHKGQCLVRYNRLNTKKIELQAKESDRNIRLRNWKLSRIKNK